jgi:hypothetical protein
VRGKYANVTSVEERADLFVRAPDGCGRRDDLWSHAVARGECVDGGLVETHHRPEGAGDQMQLVLHDELGRAKSIRQLRRALRSFLSECEEPGGFATRDASEQLRGRPTPGEHGELVDRPHDEARKFSVDVLVDEENGNALVVVAERESAIGVLASDAHGVGAGLETARIELGLAPGAGRERERRTIAPGAIGSEEISDLLEGVRGGRPPDPKADSESCGTELRVARPPELLHGAHQRGRTTELVECEQPKRVAKEDGDPKARVGASSRSKVRRPTKRRGNRRGDI